MRARADRCARNRRTDDKTLPRQRAAHHLHQRGLAAEQMGAAGNVEKQAMRGIERHQRREAVAPVGDIAQRLGVGRCIGIEHRQCGQMARALASGRPIARPETRGGIIERENLQRIVLFGDDDAGLVIVINQRVVAVAKLTLDAVDGQARQPQAEDPPPVR